MRRYFWCISSALVFLSCSDSTDTSTAPPPQPSPTQLADEWLPYGVPVPPGTRTYVRPEPYDSAKHGPPRRNMDRSTDLVHTRTSKLPPRYFRPSFSPGNGDAVWRLTPSPTNNGGIYVTNDVQLDLDIPLAAAQAAPGQFVLIYSPTHLPPDGSCIEATMVHQRDPYGPTTHWFGFWDWCTNVGNQDPTTWGTNWGSLRPADQPFVSKYVRYLHDENQFVVEVYRHTSSNCWTGMIFNYSVGQWESWVTSCGASRILGGGFTGGWTAWESYNLMSWGCPTLPSIRATSIATRSASGTYYRLAGQTTDLPGSCFANGTYTFGGYNGSSYAWEARTPF